MTRELKFVRHRISRLKEKVGDPAVTAEKQIRNMGAHRIDLVSKCRSTCGQIDLTPVARQNKWLKLMSEYINYIEEYKAEALADIDEAYNEAELLALQASELSRHRPNSSDAWTEYNARSSDLKDEITEFANTSPLKINEMYKKGEKLEDSIICFAIEEFAPKAIRAAQSELGATHPNRRAFGDALRDLTEVIGDSTPEGAALKHEALALQKSLSYAEREIRGFMLPTDEADIRKKFHMKADVVPSLLLEAGIGYVDDQYLINQIDDDVMNERRIIRDYLSTEKPEAATTTQTKLEGRVRKLQAAKFDNEK